MKLYKTEKRKPHVRPVRRKLNRGRRMKVSIVLDENTLKRIKRILEHSRNKKLEEFIKEAIEHYLSVVESELKTIEEIDEILHGF